jgi:tetratricopeptide (TPR) repeat protein
LGEERLARVAEARSATPAELRRAARGELTWIVGKCLELDPANRYPSVAHLAEELRRYLAGRPVEVGPPGAAYRVRRFVRRHRRAVGTWALVAVAVIAAGWGWAMRREYGPESRAAIYDMSARGDQLRVEGKFKDAEPLLRQAVYKAETLFGRYDSACVDPLWHLIQLLNDQRRYEEALEFNRRLFDVVRYGNLSPAWAADLSDWYGGALYQLERYPEAEAALAESIAIQERAGDRKTHKYQANIEKLISMCDRAGRTADAARWRAKLHDPATRPSVEPP